MEKCLQVYSHHQFSFKQRLHLPHTCKTQKGVIPSTSSFPCNSYPFSTHSLSRRNPVSRILCKAREATDAVQAVTDGSWNELVIASDTPVLVDFWAPWCGPCRMIAPVVDELAKEYAGKIQCYKLNTDDSPNIPKQYGIRSIPTVLFFKNGERKESIIGAVPKSTLSAVIEKYLD